MRQLEPCARPGVGEVGGVRPELLHHRAVGRVDLERHVRRGHHRRYLLARRVRGGGERLGGVADRLILVRARGASHQLIVMVEQHVEIAHVPADRRRRPRALDAGGDRVVAHAGAVLGHPAKAHMRDVGTFRVLADLGRIARAMRLAEGMPARGERGGLLVVHRHPRERLAHVARRAHRVRTAARPFRVHIDEAMLDRGERIFEREPRFRVDARLAEELFLRAPIHVLLGLEDVDATAAEAERGSAHRLDRDIAREDEQVRPTERRAIFLLHRPQQATRLVEIAVIRP